LAEPVGAALVLDGVEDAAGCWVPGAGLGIAIVVVVARMPGESGASSDSADGAFTGGAKR